MAEEGMKISDSLAIKYRPITLGKLFGQDEAVAQLTGMFKKKKVIRSLLITGPYGSGKTSLARLIAKYANCTNFDYDKVRPCGECKSCLSFTPSGPKGNHDVIEINCSEQRGIDDIRAIKSQSRYMPRGNFRVYIMDEVHGITPAAQAALLKPLEEPPSRTIFILVTTDPQNLIETIRSRCRRIEIKPMTISSTTSLLQRICEKENFDKKVDESTLKKISALTDCHPRDAITVLEGLFDILESGKKTKDIGIEQIVESVTGSPPWQLVKEYLFSVYRGSYTGAFKIIEQVDNAEFFIKDAIRYHKFSLYNTIDPDSFYDKQFYYFSNDFKKLIDTKKIVITEDLKFAMADTMNALVSTHSEIKRYSGVEAKSLILATTTRIIPWFKKAKPKKEV